MEIQQSLKVSFAPDQVWRCFHDTQAMVACLPGAALTAPPSEGKLALSMTVKLGPIIANFTGQGEMTLNDESRSGRLLGSGSDRKSGSRVKGEAAFSLHDETAGSVSTRIDIRVDYSIAGSLAQFSRGGIVRELAERMTAQFSENLRKMLDARQAAPTAPTAPAAAASTAPPAAAPTAPAAAPLDFGKMFWPLIIARLKRWLGFSAKRLDDARSPDD